MQTSRMLNESGMRTMELMREVSAMRSAEQATSSGPRARWFSPAGSLAFTIANWRRLSARRIFAGREDVVVASSQVRGA